MKVIFLAPDSYLARHFMLGWQNAFVAMGHDFVHADPAQDDLSKLLESTEAPLVMVGSGEGLLCLDLAQLKACGARVAYNGLPANPQNASFDPHTPLADLAELDFLAQIEHKTCFSQHEPEYLEAYYGHYYARGIETLYLPYAADITLMADWEFNPTPEYDLVFVGNLAHRKKGNIKPLRQIFSGLEPSQLLVYGDQTWQKCFGIKTSLLTGEIDWRGLYQSAAIAPNLHSHRQKDRMIQVNDRCFHIAAYGGFQLIDHPLAAKFFGPDELAIALGPGDLVEQFFHYLDLPELRREMIQRARERISQDHSHFNRIAALFEALQIDQPVLWQGQTYGATTYRSLSPTSEPLSLLKGRLETMAYNSLRRVKKAISPPKR